MLLLRKCEIVIPVSACKVDIDEVLNKRFGLETWFYILHDKDLNPPHYHICLWLNKVTDSTEISEVFKVPDGQVCRLDCDISSAIKYYLHWTYATDYSEMKLYDREDLHTNVNLDMYLK